MAVQTITVPGVNSLLETSDSFIKEVSTILATGKDVQFVHPDGTQAAVKSIFLTTGGSVKFRGPEAGDDVTLKFAEGGWHSQGIGIIYASGTEAGLGIHVKAL